MKRKTFYQTNILYQILICVFILGLSLLVFGFAICITVDELINGFTPSSEEFLKVIELPILAFLERNVAEKIIILGVRLPIYLFFSGMMMFGFLSLERNNVHLTEEKIYMNSDWQPRKEKIQFYTEVKFVDIEAIDIIYTRLNSRGGWIKNGAIMPNCFLVVKTKQGKLKKFFILFISNRDVLRLIDEIRLRMKNVGNDKELISNDEVLLKLKNKRNKDKKGKERNEREDNTRVDEHKT